jgi:hypothetical protein
MFGVDGCWHLNGFIKLDVGIKFVGMWCKHLMFFSCFFGGGENDNLSQGNSSKAQLSNFAKYCPIGI